jgi:hypothetical protein
MAKMSELAPGGHLHCGSPAHPAHLSRDTMYFLEEKNGFFCFGCRPCTEIQRRPQIHVIAKSYGALKIYNNTRKAALIDRDSEGHIVSFR